MRKLSHKRAEAVKGTAAAVVVVVKGIVSAACGLSALIALSLDGGGFSVENWAQVWAEGGGALKARPQRRG